MDKQEKKQPDQGHVITYPDPQDLKDAIERDQLARQKAEKKDEVPDVQRDGGDRTVR